MADTAATDTAAHNNARIDVAYQILKYLNDGKEPYAPSVMPMVRALAKYKEEIKQAYADL